MAGAVLCRLFSRSVHLASSAVPGASPVLFADLGRLDLPGPAGCEPWLTAGEKAQHTRPQASCTTVVPSEILGLSSVLYWPRSTHHSLKIVKIKSIRQVVAAVWRGLLMGYGARMVSRL